MAQWLKQSTAVTKKIGPFLDDTDGKTAETGLTIAQADVRLSKNGGDIAQKNESTSCTHDEIGVYGCPLDITDTNTLGILQLWVHESGALPVWHEFMVVPANVWDSMFGSDMLKVDVHAIDDDETAANNLESYCDGTTPIPANATQISDDATAANNAESFFDGTGYAGTNNVIPTVTALTGHTAQTGDNYARLGAPAGASVSADIVAIEAQTDDIGVAGAGLTAVPWNAAWDAQVQSEVQDALEANDLDHLIQVSAGVEEPTDGSYLDQVMHKNVSQTFDPTTDSLEAIRDTAPLGTAMRGTDSAALASVCTETRLAELDAANLPTDIAALPTTAEVNTEVDTALSDIHLDHLLAVDYDPASKPGTATALLNEIIESDGGVSRYTANALEEAPTGGSAPTVSEIRTEMDDNSTQLAAIVADTNELQTDDVPGLIAALNDVSTAEVNTQVDTALRDIHLDHLLAVDYDPASKPGIATALLNELVESDAGVSRFTENALEEAPTGGSVAAADVWAYGTRTLTQSAASVAAAVSGTDLSILRGDTLSITITGLGDISGRTKLWFTIKEQMRDADTVSIVQIEETAGLLYINGGAAATSGNGSITVDDETAGDVTIMLEAIEVAKLRPSNSLNYDIQVLDSSGVSTLSAADAVVPADVTRVVE